MFNSQTIKKYFPVFSHHKDLVYLDSAATALKPQVVINTEREYLEQYSANVGRGLYPLAETATEKFETVREQVSVFIGAQSPKEIIFTSGTTASINLISNLIAHTIDQTDNIVTTELEHHSNFLPWKELIRAKNATFQVAPITRNGLIDLEALKSAIDEHTKIVAFSAVSNVLGTISPVAEIVKMVRNINPKTIILVDAAQAIGHAPINISEWDADFVVFSAHKMFGPTGVGVLYGKKALLETLSPVVFGGGMVLDVYPTSPGRVYPISTGRACAKETLYREIPYRFEAGTPNIGGVIALGAAIKYIESIGLKNIRYHETVLIEYTVKRLRETFGNDIQIIGPEKSNQRGGIIAFSFADIHPHDIAHLLGEKNICVRAGEHCAAPLHRRLNLTATTRISLSIYNSEEDIESLIDELKKIVTLLKM